MDRESDVSGDSKISEHEHWDFPPTHPPLADERPDTFPDDLSDEEAYQAYYESRCGTTHESRPVELYHGEFEVSEKFVDAHQGPVGQIQWNHDLGDLDIVHQSSNRYAGVRWCSGTLIDDDLLLTAGHCLALQNMPRPAEVARNMHVNFNYQVNPDGELRDIREYDIVELVEHEFEFGGLDYAIVRLDGEPGSEFGTIDVAATDAREGDTLCIISHPDGLPKRIEAGHTTHLHDVRIGYGDIDTAYGSSGAGILEGQTGKLVGVHTMGGCDRIRGGHNHGIRISDIREASSTVQGLAPGSKTGDGQTQVTQTSTSESQTCMLEAHKSSLEAHKSSLEAHKSSLEAHKSSLELHGSKLDSHRLTLEAHRKMLELHEDTLESSVESLDEFTEALGECTSEFRVLVEELREQVDGSAEGSGEDDGPGKM